MITYKNECKKCGKPKRGGEYCAACFLALPRQEVHCITASIADLDEVIARKEAQGLKCHGEALAIGGWWVQMMVKEAEEDHPRTQK